MRILLLTQFYPPTVGGEERHVLALARALAQRGHEVHVGTYLLRPDQPSLHHDDGVVVHRIRHVGLSLPWAFLRADRPLALPTADPVAVRQLKALVKGLRPDVIHAHNWIVNSALGLARRTRTPLVLTLHDYSHVCATKRLVRHDAVCPGAAVQRCLPCASKHYDALRGPLIYAAVRAGKRIRERVVDEFISVSDYVADRSELDGVRMARVITNFVPDDLLDAPRAPRDPSLPSGPFAFFAGDLSVQKGAHTLLEAHAGIQGDRLPLVLAGRVVDDLPHRPDDVTTQVEWEHARVVNAFQHCALAVLPSEWPDPCPTTVLEAMALGAPLITTRMGGIATLVEPGRSAVCVPPGDPAALARAITTLSWDQAERSRLAAEGRRRVERFTLGRVVNQLVDVYQTLQ